MKYLVMMILVVGCGKQVTVKTVQGPQADPIQVPVPTSIDISDALTCFNGGTQFTTYKDLNGDSEFSLDETALKVKIVCNGINGQNGNDGKDGLNGKDAELNLSLVAAGEYCPNGGLKLNGEYICNGLNGLNGQDGEDGIDGKDGVNGKDGLNGVNGLNGKDGSIIVPVKFCKDDKSTFPEYGLMIDGDLWAVYWGTTPASPKVSQAFLTKLVPGSYMSTGGNNCQFSVK